jgi:hypothetical protein
MVGYHTKWPTGWTNEWFYVKADEKKREKLMTMVMSPLKLSYDSTFVQYAARVPLPIGQSGIQGGG